MICTIDGIPKGEHVPGQHVCGKKSSTLLKQSASFINSSNVIIIIVISLSYIHSNLVSYDWVYIAIATVIYTSLK